MAVDVYLVKRYLRARQRNGKRKYRWALRWCDPHTGEWRCESCKTADKAKADAQRKAKWDNLNSPDAPRQLRPSWDDCRDAVERAMQADHCRPTYVADALICLDSLKRMFPAVKSPADVTEHMAHEWKRRRSESGLSPYTVKGDLATLRAVFGKWLGRECGLLHVNPFVGVKPPRCDEMDARIISADESKALFDWLGERWKGWQLPVIYLRVLALTGWRATEVASLREEDLLADGFIRVASASSKTRRIKHGWLPDDLYGELRTCAANGYVFGRFSDDLRRLLAVAKKRPHHAARVQDFLPKRLVGWLQDELSRFNAERLSADPKWESLTLHDFRRTAISDMYMVGVPEKEVSTMVGVSPEVIRRHYEKLDQLVIAKRNTRRRLRLVS